ncbi:MAG TPA: hypothetical protein VGY31_08710 [Terriglobia bacterium]|nr:hypothetical protein [Terriglobia bacterium]
MFLDFGIKGIAECNGVLAFAVRGRPRIFIAPAPEADLIEEVKPSPVKKDTLIAPIFCSEENRRAKDPLERAGDSPVIKAGCRQIEVTQEFG